jgi:hypothetical protein
MPVENSVIVPANDLGAIPLLNGGGDAEPPLQPASAEQSNPIATTEN